MYKINNTSSPDTQKEIQVNCVIVTYNRIDLLKECIASVCMQTFSLYKIIVINNASSDDTLEYLGTLLEPQFKIINLEKNIGGAGGFNIGMKESLKIGADWTWLMDDDTIPCLDALEKMINRSHIIKNTGFLASRVLWTDRTVHKMNANGVGMVHNIPFSEYIEYNMLLLPQSSFVSCLINHSAVASVGYPIADFFIWADDMEYTKRITNAGFFGALVFDSIVIHKTAQNYSASLSDATPDAFWKFYYGQRNQIYFLRQQFPFFVKYFYMYIKTFIKSVKQCLKNRNGRFKLLCIVSKGIIDGFFFYPKIEYVGNNK